jgi:flagellar M-ring protein FliF
VSDGYAISKLSIAVLINRPRLIASLGADPTPDAIERRLEDVRQVVASAAGVNNGRGDNIKVLAVDFLQGSRSLEPEPSIGITEALLRQSGTLINAIAILAVAALIIWFGLRPSINAILKRAPATEVATLVATETPAIAATEAAPALVDDSANKNLIENLTLAAQRSPVKTLEKLIDFNEAQAAAILKRWIHEGEHA